MSMNIKERREIMKLVTKAVKDVGAALGFRMRNDDALDAILDVPELAKHLDFEVDDHRFRGDADNAIDRKIGEVLFRASPTKDDWKSHKIRSYLKVTADGEDVIIKSQKGLVLPPGNDWLDVEVMSKMSGVGAAILNKAYAEADSIRDAEYAKNKDETAGEEEEDEVRPRLSSNMMA